MTQQNISTRRRQVLMMGAAAGAAPVVAPAMTLSGAMLDGVQSGAVVSGRVVSAVDGRGLAGAHIEIWNDAVRVSATADGDGRYFAAVDAGESRLNYRVTHHGHATQLTQLRLNGVPQRTVARVHDETGAARAAFEIALSSPAAGLQAVAL